MFEDSLASASAPVRSGAVRLASMVSLGVQAAIAAVICALPLFHPLALTVPKPLAPLFVPVLRREPPKTRVTVSAVSPASAAAPSIALPQAPTIHNDIPASTPEPETTSPMLPFGAGAIPAAALSGAGETSALGATRATAAAEATVKRGPLRVSSGVNAGLLLTPIRPVYPQIARSAHVEGTVVVRAVISREGKIVQANVTQGPAMLAQAALDAVRNARYRPFLLNGEPTDVDTTFSIVFRLGSL